MTVTTVQPRIAGRLHGAWSARCRLCPDWTPDCYRTEPGARHGAATHLWEQHVQKTRPRLLCGLTGKRCHASRALALEHIRSLYRAGRGNPDYQAYVCPSCGDWHVGHSKSLLSRRIRKVLR